MKTGLEFGEEPVKRILYPPELRNGRTNHGFISVKGNGTDVADIVEEAKRDPGLAAVLREINRAETPLFSLGCDNLHITEGLNRFGGQGYIEIAFNILEEAKDSVSYFRLFERFTEFARTSAGNLLCSFMIQRALFPPNDVEAFTVQIWLMIPTAPTKQEVENLWRAGLNTLEKFVATLTPSSVGTRIF